MFDYLSEHETRPHHFFIPMLIAIVGGVFAHIKTWEWVGYLICGFAVIAAVWLFYSSYKKHQINEIKEHYWHDTEITKLDAAKTTTKVVIDKTPLTGYMRQSFNELNLPPGKLLKFARGVMNDGRPLTIREWTPLKKGKEFSDPQWRNLIAFLRQPDWEDRKIKFIVPINVNNPNDSFELTAAGEKWLNNVLEQSEITVLAPA